jgi:hypothetical protein
LTAVGEARETVAPRLGPREAGVAADALAAAQERLPVGGFGGAERVLLRALAALFTRLEPGRAAADVIARLGTASASALSILAEGVVAAAQRLSSREAAEVADALTAALRRTSGDQAWAVAALARALSATSAKLGRKQAAAAAEALAQAIRKAREHQAMGALGEALADVAARAPQDADPLCAGAVETLAPVLSKTRRFDAAPLGAALEALAARLGPKEARLLADSLANEVATKDGETSYWQARVLAAAAGRLGAKEAVGPCRKAAAALVAALSERSRADHVQALAVLLPRLGPAFGELVDSLLAALDGADWKRATALAEALAAVARQATRKEAGRIVAALLRAIRKGEDSKGLAEALSVAAARLEPAEAAAAREKAAAVLEAALRKLRLITEDELEGLLEARRERRIHGAFEFKELAQGLACLGAMGGRETFETLLAALSKTDNRHDRVLLAEGLAATASRLAPDDAASACARAADVLFAALSATTNPYEQGVYADALAAMAARLEPELAAGALMTALTRARGSAARDLTAALLTILSREAAGQSHVRTAAALSSLESSRFTALALLHPALRPPPLPAQPLVEMLKHPLCVGEARLIILAQLSRHYGRPFADQWDFVRYATENRLDLDLTSSPRRPEPR